MNDAPIDRHVHGGLGPEEDRSAAGSQDPSVALLDLSVNINPYGPPPALLEAVRDCPIHAYPEPTAVRLRRSYGRRLGISPERIVFGNGATELLWALARHFATRLSPTLILEPTFSEYARAAEVAGMGALSHWSRPPEFRHDLDELLSAARDARAGSVYLCRPDNPTGQVIPRDDVERLARSLAPTQIILDESFLSLSDAANEARIVLPENVIRVRSLTKDFGIPGLRLGYLIASSSVASALRRQLPPWTPSAPAQAAALAALDEGSFVEESRRRLLGERDRLQSWLAARGMRPLPSATIFLLLHVGSGRQFRSALMEHRVVVRDATSFGLPEHARVAVGSAEMTRQLRAAIDAADLRFGVSAARPDRRV